MYPFRGRKNEDIEWGLNAFIVCSKFRSSERSNDILMFFNKMLFMQYFDTGLLLRVAHYSMPP